MTIFVLIFTILFSFSSCDTKYPKELEDNITVHSAENNLGYDIEYLGQTYNYRGLLLYVTEDGYNNWADEGDILLSWNRILLGYIDFYYSETDENPLFIYETRLGNVFTREDYDYLSDAFTFEGKEEPFTFSEYFSLHDCSFSFIQEYRSQYSVTLVSKTNSRLRIRLSLCNIDGQWYADDNSCERVFYVSNEFIDLLTRQGIDGV